MSASGKAPRKHPRVLIVDDEPLVALYVADVIGDAGDFEIETSGSASHALATAARRPPDVAIVDLSLGGGPGGTSVAAELKSTHNTMIIFLSGRSDIQDDPEVRQVKPVAILSKPCLAADLTTALCAALGEKAR
jgi:two-component system, response regulator PdtaR